MTPRVSDASLDSQLADLYEKPETAATNRDIDRLLMLRDAEHGSVKARMQKRRIELRAVEPYGAGSEHGNFEDLARAQAFGDSGSIERLNRHRAAMEQRAVGSSTLNGFLPAQLAPDSQEQVGYGLRSTAPVSVDLVRLDPPENSLSAQWVNVSTAATAGVQTAENVAIPQSADDVAASATDPIRTIAAYIDVTFQARERSGGWTDLLLGEELGRALGSTLEQQIFSGSGSSGQLTGLANATGASNSTVAGQTVANIWSKIMDQYRAVGQNLGQLPDRLLLAPRRTAQLFSNIPAPNLPPGLEIITSPGAPTNLGTSEDWPILLRRDQVPLVAAAEPSLEWQSQGPSAGGSVLVGRFVIYLFVALGVHKRPEAIGQVRGSTNPTL